MSTTCLYFICDDNDDDALVRLISILSELEKRNPTPAIMMAKELGLLWKSEFSDILIYNVIRKKHIVGETYLEFSIGSFDDSDEFFELMLLAFNGMGGVVYGCVVGYSSTGVEYSLSVYEDIVNWKERRLVNSEGWKVLVSGEPDTESSWTIDRQLEDIGCVRVDDPCEADVLVVGPIYDNNLQAMFRAANKPILIPADFSDLIEECYRI